MAILQVLVLHYFADTSSFAPGSGLAYLAALATRLGSGVDNFFVLSGFLIGGILIDARSSHNYFGTFYARRFYRILPVYLAWCLLFWIAAGSGLAGRIPGTDKLLADPLPWSTYITFTQNFWMVVRGGFGPLWLGITWSLAIEEQFYLTLPLVVRFVRVNLLPYILVVVIIAAPLLRAMCYTAFNPFAAYVLMPCRADALMLGVCGAMLVRSQGWKLLVAHQRLLQVTLVVLFAGVLVVTSDTWQQLLPIAALEYTWLALFYLCVILIALSQPKSVLSRILRNRVLIELGTLAYCTYLIHQAILYLCHGLIKGQEAQLNGVMDGLITVLALAFTLIVAKLSWIYFEKPLVKLGHQHKYEAAAVPQQGLAQQV